MNGEFDENKILEGLPKEAREKLEKIKKTVENFKDKVLEKFEEYVLGIALLPPDPENKEKIRVLVLIDDSDTKKMTKEELKHRLDKIIGDIAKSVNENIQPNVLLLTLLWEELYDGNYEILKEISISAPIYDKGMLAALRITEIHKRMVIEKFEKYVVCYVFAGSLVQGKATKDSDIDVFIVVDDTDVKRMSRVELKDKLRAIIIGMGIEAGRITGIENKLNIQVYILTDFWESIREANPVIFTFLRDGVPLYDRGIFMVWKQLLKMGRIRPSPEAIEMYKASGEQMIKRVELKIREILSEDFFWSTFTPTQAAIMLYGLPPPTPRETPHVVRDIFVKKEKMLEEEYVKILEKILETRKGIEQGKIKEVKGRDVDELLRASKKYLNRLNKLFKEIEDRKTKEKILSIYDTVISVTRDALKLEGVEQVGVEKISAAFKEKIVNKNYVTERYYRLLNEIIKAKDKFLEGKLSKVELEQVVRKSKEYINKVVEFIERKKSRELEKVRIHVRYGNKIGEVFFLESAVYFVLDVGEEEKEVRKAKIMKKGELGKLEASSIEELEREISNMKSVRKPVINKSVLEKIKEVFGEEAEMII